MPSPSAEAVARIGAVAEDAPRKVLVVDDEPTIVEVVARYLERAGYEATRPPTGRRRCASLSCTAPISSSST